MSRNQFLMCLVAGSLAMTPAGAKGQKQAFSAGHPMESRVVPANPAVTASARPAANPRAAAASPQGCLVLVGGGQLPDVIRQRFLELAGGKKARIIIIPSASGRPDAAARCFAFWKTAAVQSVRILHTTRRSDADDPHFYAPLRDATGVWLSGGDQSRLTAIYGGTAVERELSNVLHRGGVVGGTSAGASVVSAVMMVDDRKTGKGFGLIAHTIIDQHFNKRHRLQRLLSVVQSHPDQFGIGIDEMTAVVIRGGDVAVLGIGRVTVVRPDSPRPTCQVHEPGKHFPQPTLLTVASR